jgi:ribosomal L32p-like protein
MAVPKRKKSHSRTRSRRAQRKAEPACLVPASFPSGCTAASTWSPRDWPPPTGAA